MKPAYPYFGGKTKLAPHIVPLIPKHTVYVEPCFGSGAVMFAKPWPNIKNPDMYREVCNDYDDRIINFYKVLMDRSKQDVLLNKLEHTPYHQGLYAESIDICNNPSKFSDIDTAWAFFVNISMSFANRLNGGWGKTLFKYNGAVAWKRRSVEHLEDIIKRLDGVYFSNVDVLDCIKMWDAPQTCFYIDPPYVNTEQGHYKGYTQQDFDNLIKTLQECKSSFLLSCYDNVSIPKSWERFEFKSMAHASGKGRVHCDKSKSVSEKDCSGKERTEIILRVVRNQNVRPEIQKLFDSGTYDCFTG